MRPIKPLRPIKPEQVLEIIKAMKKTESTGLDHLDTYIIKLVTPNILPALTHVINMECFQMIGKKPR